MRCPKCGFNSFEYLDSCRKCSSDLTEFKAKFGLRSLLNPGRETPAAPVLLPEASPTAELLAQGDGVDFGFDFMGEGSQDPTENRGEPTALDQPDVAGEPGGEIHSGSGDPLPALAFGTDWDDSTSPDDFPSPGPTGVGEDEPFTFDEDLEGQPALPQPAQDEVAGGLIDFQEEVPELPSPEDDADLDFAEEEELPPLETGAELAGWDFLGEESAPDKEEKKEGLREEPRDPFNWRGSDEPVRAPLDAGGSEAAGKAVAGRDLAFREGEAEAEETPDWLAAETGEDGAVRGGKETPGISDCDEPAQAELPLFPTVTSKGADHRRKGAEETAFDLWAQQEEDSFSAGAEGSQTTAPIALRFGAGLVDSLVLTLAFVLFLMAGELALSPSETGRLLPTAEELLALSVPYFLVVFTLCFGYFTLFHFLTGQSIGKMLFRLRVEGMDGSPLIFSQAFLHSAGGVLCFLSMGVGFLAAAFDHLGRGWNDRLAATRVVRAGADTWPAGDQLEGMA